MKRVLFSMVLVMAACVTFAQSKDAKEAKKIASGTNPDFAKAEQLINADLQNPEFKNDAANWDVAGFIQKRINEKEMEKAYLRQPYDTLKAYNSVLNMYNYWMKTDELAEVPDEKGKIKNRFRKNNVATMMIERPNLINGGIQYFNENNNAEAFKFFAMYIDAAKHSMFEKENLLKNDTLVPQIAYYAALAAAKMEDYPKVLKYAPYAVDNKEVGAYAMEFISTAYKAEGDTVQWIKSLQDGIQKYPDYPFFFGHLIDYYSNNNKFDEAMVFADDMLARDPGNTFFLYVKGYLYHNMKDYDKAIEFYKKTIDADPNYAEAYSNIGLVYSQQAQEFADNATADLNDPKYAQDQEKIRELNELARPYYEKTRQLKPDQPDLWLQGLYRIYYNLNMGPEFKEIEELMGI
ncbi:tetratricopeptide repeat protein [Bacteroides sp. 519]|uniref:tetratricopeptide repeat protein n=1 Tax=Bacteroides sp. 519 TaxID=2302937 RepID=UPI0013D42360|nr:tetratricopeptide repeat protein [Bacteroides sp. 519]NDV59975.1 tetratricopeptide repeat protein [Bacteroides sp. 519]